MFEAADRNGAGGGGVSYVDDEVNAGVIRDRFIDDGTRLYISGVTDRTGVENSSLVAGGFPLNDRPTMTKMKKNPF
jgi:hypothetical protein